jgi:hypothetical protein
MKHSSTTDTQELADYDRRIREIAPEVRVTSCGESFVTRFYRVYPEAESFLKRACFYAGAQEVRWLLTGIERNDPWWFAVHVGGAKDWDIVRSGRA